MDNQSKTGNPHSTSTTGNPNSSSNPGNPIPPSILAGKKLIILGGTSGLGLATAEAATAEGAKVTIVSSSQQRIDQYLQQQPAGREGYALHLSHEPNIKSFVGRA